MTESIYDMEKRLERVVRSVKANPSLTRRKKQLILRYKDEMLVNGLSTGRAVRFTYYVLKLGTWLPCEFKDANLGAIKTVVSKIEASDYVPFSKMEYKLALRRFYRWLRGTEDYPPEVKWIPTRVKACGRTKLPEELLAEKDVEALIDAGTTPRDRAFVALLYETGTRVSELALVRLKHMQFDAYGATLVVCGKTGSRRVRVISSVPLLTEWINVHPYKNNPDAYLWVTNRGGAPTYSAVARVLRRMAGRAGVKKRVNPHTFRHSRATRLACHLTESQMKEYFGWVQASRMAGVYVHLSGRDVDDALLKLYGMKKEAGGQLASVLKPRTCSRCKTENPSTNCFCKLCGLPLDSSAAAQALQNDFQRRKADDLLDAMLEDRDFKDMFLRK
ncbi:MAG TPA: site-specific integrase, partial [Planctomycetota bacterium]|nr:site-specific integrase [Planctomycetota bacterium]